MSRPPEERDVVLPERGDERSLRQQRTHRREDVPVEQRRCGEQVDVVSGHDRERRSLGGRDAPDRALVLAAGAVVPEGREPDGGARVARRCGDRAPRPRLAVDHGRPSLPRTGRKTRQVPVNARHGPPVGRRGDDLDPAAALHPPSQCRGRGPYLHQVRPARERVRLRRQDVPERDDQHGAEQDCEQGGEDRRGDQRPAQTSLVRGQRPRVGHHVRA